MKPKHGQLMRVVGLGALLFFLSITSIKSLELARANEEKDPILITLIAGGKSCEGLVTTASGYFAKEWYSNPDPLILDVAQDEQLQQTLKQPPHLAEIFWATFAYPISDLRAQDIFGACKP